MALNTIWLKGDGLVKEAKAGGGMTPGHLIKRNASNEFVVHATAGGDAAPRMFALEQDFVGKGIATAYVQNDQVQALVPQPGAEIYALVPAAAAAVVIGDKLESNGDGTLRKQDPQDQPEENGLYIDGNLAISATAEKFKTTATAYFKIGGVQYNKVATDNLTFSAADTINVGAAAGTFWGIWLVQINAAGTISTKSPSADQVYASAAAALAALPAVDAGNVSLGYIRINSKVNLAWTANTDDMTDGSDVTTATFVDGAVVTITPTAIVQESVVAVALEAVDNSGGGSSARIKVEIV